MIHLSVDELERQFGGKGARKIICHCNGLFSICKESKFAIRLELSCEKFVGSDYSK